MHTPPCFTPAARLFIIKAAAETPRQIYAGVISCRRSGIISAAGDAIRENPTPGKFPNVRNYSDVATFDSLQTKNANACGFIKRSGADNAEGCILDGMKRGRQLQRAYISDNRGTRCT